MVPSCQNEILVMWAIIPASPFTVMLSTPLFAYVHINNHISDTVLVQQSSIRTGSRAFSSSEGGTVVKTREAWKLLSLGPQTDPARRGEDSRSWMGGDIQHEGRVQGREQVVFLTPVVKKHWISCHWKSEPCICPLYIVFSLSYPPYPFGITARVLELVPTA